MNPTAKAAPRPAGRPAAAVAPTTRLAQWAIVLIGVSPIVIVPRGLDRFVFGKLAFVAAGIALAWFAPAAGRLKRPVVWGLGVVSALLALAAVVSGHPLVSLLGREPRFEGIAVLFVYGVAIATGAGVFGSAERSPIVSALLVSLSVAALAIALIAVLEAFGLRPLTSNVSRPGSLLGNASDEGAVGVLIFGPLAVAALGERRRMYGIGAVASVLIVVLSASRGAFVALLVELVVWALIAGSRQVRVTVLAVAVAAVGVSFAIPATRDRLTDASPLAHHTVVGRELLWRETLRLDSHHLLLGIGSSNYESAITAEHNLEWQKRVGPANPPDSPHDLPLQVLSDAGILGLLAGLSVVGLIGVYGVRAARSRRTESAGLAVGSLVGIAGYAVTLLVGLTSPGPTALAAVLAGVLVADGVVDAAAAAPPSRGARSGVGSGQPATRLRMLEIGVAGVAALCAVLFVLAGVAEIALRSAVLDVAAGNASGADHDFQVAHALRFWDPDLADVAGHAFITEASVTNSPAMQADANDWLARVPSQLNGDEQVRLDRELADELAGQLPAAQTLLTQALADDPDNPDILLRRGVVEGEQANYPAAIRDLLQSSRIAAGSPAPWQDLAVVYGRQNRPNAAAAARRRARQLGG
jgi:O-antigen ligase